jgi:hypothetical protein
MYVILYRALQDVIPSYARTQTSPFGINSFDLDNLLRAEGLRDPLLRQAIVTLHMEIRQVVDFHNGMRARILLKMDLLLPSKYNTRLVVFIDPVEASLFKILSSTKGIVLQLQQGIQLKEACWRSLRNWYMSDNLDLKIEKVLSNLEEKVNSNVKSEPL